MINVKEVFEERKNEIEFYYSVLDSYEKENATTHSVDMRLFRIMKSNLVLMLYNLVEATFSAGMLEIYEIVKNEKCTYKMVIDEIKTVWRDAKIRQVYSSSAKVETYTNKVKEIVEHITDESPLILGREMLNINGNLNAGRIKNLCKQHGIFCRAKDKDEKLEEVLRKRNSLAHGEESFAECSRDMTIDDLKIIKDTVILFMSNVIVGMENYCDNKKYLKAVSV